MKIQVTIFCVLTLCSDVVGYQTFLRTMLPPFTLKMEEGVKTQKTIT